MDFLKNKRSSLLRGAIIITITSLILKILSVVYRIPYQNIAGDIGFYVLQQVYPVYAIAVALSTYGFPVILSKQIAEGNSNDKIKSYFIGLTFVSFFLFGCGYLGSDYISLIMGDQNLKVPLQLSFIYFLFIPFLSLGRGYFQGQQNMSPTAISQLVEQSIRVFLILGISLYFIKLGLNSYNVGSGAVIGSIIGGLASSILLVYFFIKNYYFRDFMGYNFSLKDTITFLKDGILVCISSLILILFQLVDAFTVLNGLLTIETNPENAMALKGIYDRGQPLIQVGSIIATSLALTIVPFLSSAKKNGDTKYIKERITSAIKINIIIGTAAAVGLFLIVEDANIMLFENSRGSDTLKILSVAILLGSVAITSSGVLQGIGNIKGVGLNCLLGLIFKVILNIILVNIYGINGAAISTIISLIIISLLNLILLRKVIKISLNVKYIKKFIFAVLLMSICVLGTEFIVKGVIQNDNRISSTISSVLSVGVGIISYFYFLIKLSLFKREEMQVIPKGVRIYEIINNK